jgi:hypothetical protein
MTAMHRDKRSRGVLVGLAAAAGAFGAAAMMSAATAPTARADDFTDIISNVEGLVGDGQYAFSSADMDFASNDVPAGLASLFDGVYDDSVGVQDEVYLGTLVALAGGTPPGSAALDFNGEGPPTDFASAVSGAEGFFTDAENIFTEAMTELSSGDYYYAALAAPGIPIDAFDLPAEYLVIGAVEALGF